MDDKVQSVDSHVWTLGDFIERRNSWNQLDEVQLAKYLEQLSKKIAQGAKSTLNDLDDLVTCVDDTAVKVANINNEFQLLADKQFIENKVQDEDETVQKLPEKSIENKFDGVDTLVDDLKTAVKNSFNVIETHFEKVTVVISDSDDDDLKHEETILRPRHLYKKLRLPTITGSVQSEEIETNNMSSDSESYVKQSSKDELNQESLSSSDAEIVDDIQSISKDIQINQPCNENAQTVVNSQNISYEPKTSVSIPQITDNDNEDIFSPPPLSYDNDDEDDNEYNMFGPSTNDMYGEQNLWEDDYENDYSNEPPLPICPDDFPKPIPQSNVEEKNLISDVQQSLNDELRKRFHKENISSTEDINKEPQSEIPRKKIPKGAVNILGGSSNSAVRHVDNLSSIIELPKETLSKNTTKSNQATDNHEKTVSKNLMEDKKLPVINKESKTKKVRSFFDVDTDSDEENLFVKKANVTSVKPVISKKIETSENIKNVGIFSESDPDEDLPISKPSKQNIASSHTLKLLDSSSDDDLFNVKPTKSKSASTFSNNTDKNIFENSKAEAYEELKSSSEHNQTKEKNKDNNKDGRVNSSPIVSDNNSVLNDEIKSSAVESVKPQKSNTLSTTKEQKKSSFLFSSDEEDALFNVKKSTKVVDGNNILPSQSRTANITSNVLPNVQNKSKLDLFDSSSDDDDLFNISKLKKKTTLPEKTQSENTTNISINDTNVNNKLECTEIIDDNSDKIEQYSVSNSIFSEYQDLLSNNSISTSPTTPVMIKSNMSSSSDEFYSPVLRIEKKSEEKEHPEKIISVDLLNNIDCVLTEKDKNEPREQPMEFDPKDNNVPWLPDSDGEQYSTPKFDSNIKTSENIVKTTKTDFIQFSNADYKDSSNSDFPDGSSMSSQISKDESSMKLPGKLHKNAGAFINVASLLPNSKKPLKLSNVPSNTEESSRVIDLPNSEAKLFSAGKDRAKIQVKRRPQSRKARQAAARMSAVEFGYEQNLQVKSRMFGSASDLVDYHSSPALLDEDNSDLKNNQKKIKAAISDNKIESNNDSISDVKDNEQKVELNSDLVKLNKDNYIKFDINLSDDDDKDDYDIFESNKKSSTSNDRQPEKILKFDQLETSRRGADDSDSKLDTTNTINNIASALFVADDDDSDDLFEFPKTQHTKNSDNETESEVQQGKLKTFNEETSKNEVSCAISSDDIINTDETNKQSGIIQEEKIEKLDVKTSETKSKKKYDLLLSADDDDDNIFLSKSKAVKPTTSNLFDSDDDLDFDKKATGISKKDLAKSKSLFGDDSDDDLFTNKTTTPSKFASKKPSEQAKNLPNRASVDGYVKLTAESVADNPLL